jgi:hypothetical protein
MDNTPPPAPKIQPAITLTPGPKKPTEIPTSPIVPNALNNLFGGNSKRTRLRTKTHKKYTTKKMKMHHKKRTYRRNKRI